MDSNDNIGNDDVFARLTELFGELLSADLILSTCQLANWKLSDCIDTLIQHTSSSDSAQQSDINDDLDIIIESEEIQTFPTIKLSVDTKPFYPSSSTGAIPKTNLPDPPPSSSSLSAQQPVMMSSMLKHNSKYFYDRQPPPQYTKQPKLSASSVLQTDQMDAIFNAIQCGHKIMIILRGPPGCGKTYLSREIIDKTMNRDYVNHIFSTDDYFLDMRNRYVYDRSKLTDAHEFNKERVRDRTANGWSPIIVDNTMNKVWEMYPYVEYGIRYGYLVEIVEVRTPWSKSAGRLAGKNRHNVPRDKIERMLQTYEPTTIDDIMRSLNLRYECIMPQMRCYPIMINEDDNGGNQIDRNQNGQTNDSVANKLMIEPIWNHNWNQSDDKKNNFKEFDDADQPKPPRGSNTKQIDPFEIAVKQLDKLNNEWTSFEKERVNFWTQNDATPIVDLDTKTSASTINANQNNDSQNVNKNYDQSKMCSILKTNSNETTEDQSTTTDDISHESAIHQNLDKHSIGCANENAAFAQIRQIYPNVSLDTLWDLFYNCNGDPDWTMDILLKDEIHVENFERQRQLNNNEPNCYTFNFQCNCNNDLSLMNSNHINKNELIADHSQLSPSILHRPKKDKRSSLNNVEIKKQIEENFILSDQHYSTHTRKIRDIRRGLPPPPPPTQQGHTIIVDGSGYSFGNESGSSPMANDLSNEGATAQQDDDETQSSTDEFIEIDLGTELVRQLDNAFGIDVFKRNDNYNDLKTNVFMPRDLAQQLYALWMESLFNQVEEQRQQSIRDDENFARQLNATQCYPELNHQSQHGIGSSSKKMMPTAGLKDIIDMEYAWTAYKTKSDEWNRVSPKDLAARMTHDKLAELFPDANRDSLIQVFAAHENNFDETINVLKETLRTNVADRVEKSGRALLERAKSEVELAPSNLEMLRAASDSTQQRSIEIKKLGAEEAKRSALKDFEDCRNSAAHHTQLKAECYMKAQESIQRSDTAVALYYSQIANLHKDKIDMYNHKAANLIMEVHNLTHKNSDMLDLHYLHATEAIQSLDIFLDQHITKLRNSTTVYKYVFVITGRGLHSAGGFATIKIRTKSRLKERQMTWHEVNPGLLKVKIHTTSRFANNAN